MIDIFEKTTKFTRAKEAMELGLYPFFQPLEDSDATTATFKGKQVVMIGSNNYLGLTIHPRVKEAAIEAVRKYGTSCTGSRFLNGTLEMHIELEDRLAKFVEKEAALVYSTGFQVNLGTIPAVLDRGDIVITDKEVHASIVDGVRQAKVQKNVHPRHYRHNDIADLEKILKSCPSEPAKLVIVDGVFSMGGDIAPLPEIIPLCRAHGARLMVDDAHSLGVLGRGRGTAQHFGCVDDVDLVMGTFSKSLASVGGFIAGPKEAIHWIQHFSRPFIFSASLPPANVATVLACLDILEQEPERVVRLLKVGERMRTELKAMGYDIGLSQTPIIPIVIGDQFNTLRAWKILYDAGIYTNVALPPAVPPNSALLRTSYMATHTDAHLDKVLETFKAVKDELQLSG